MFDDIHARYDLLNSILSFGLDRIWRREAVKGLPGDGIIVDLCGGGGQMALELVTGQGFQGCFVIADMAPLMISKVADVFRNRGRHNILHVICDVENLPFKASAFDGAISGFGLRNLADLSAFSSEVRRVVKSGCVANLLEIGQPDGRIFGTLFRFYFYRLTPILARIFTSKTYAYRYLPQSLAAFPPWHRVLDILGRGWGKASCRRIMRGIAVIYTLRKAGEADDIV